MASTSQDAASSVNALRLEFPVEISWRNGWLTDAEFSDLADPLVKSGYGTYMHSVLSEGRTAT